MARLRSHILPATAGPAAQAGRVLTPADVPDDVLQFDRERWEAEAARLPQVHESPVSGVVAHTARRLHRAHVAAWLAEHHAPPGLSSPAVEAEMIRRGLARDPRDVVFGHG